jgi:7-cyano-7-deazaguanine synthase in queuosine biosynthesis
MERRYEMEWHDTFVVKDAIKILKQATLANGKFVTSFQPEKLQRLTDVMLDCPERPEGYNLKIVPPSYEYKHICLTSGGADSTIGWYYSGKPQGLYIDIGQRYALKERGALSRSQIPYTYVDMRGTRLGEYVGWKHIIPGRNFLFLCVAAEMLQDYGNIWFGMVDGEGAESDKGDKSLMFVEYFMDWYKACTGREIYVQTLHNHTKTGWLKWFGQHNDVNIIRKDTVTCFNAVAEQCGQCQACLRKYLSFISLGMDIAEDFIAHPMFGAAKYVIKYKKVLKECIDRQSYGHYSRNRCVEDLHAIKAAELLMIDGRTA